MKKEFGMKRSNDIEERARMLMDFFAAANIGPCGLRTLPPYCMVPKDSRDELRDVLISGGKGKIITDEKAGTGCQRQAENRHFFRDAKVMDL